VKIQSLGLPGRADGVDLLESTLDRSRAVYGAERDGRLVEMYLFVAAVYFVMCLAGSMLVRRLQRRIAVIR